MKLILMLSLVTLKAALGEIPSEEERDYGSVSACLAGPYPCSRNCNLKPADVQCTSCPFGSTSHENGTCKKSISDGNKELYHAAACENTTTTDNLDELDRYNCDFRYKLEDYINDFKPESILQMMNVIFSLAIYLILAYVMFLVCWYFL